MTWTEEQFNKIVVECLDRQGWYMPKDTVDYTVQLLVEHMDRQQWSAEPSYAEQYLQVRTPEAALTLGNTCFFTRAVFPTLNQHRGIGTHYYTDLGRGCYDMVLKHREIGAVRTLRDHFDFVAEMIYTAIWSQGGIRTMWNFD